MHVCVSVCVCGVSKEDEMFIELTEQMVSSTKKKKYMENEYLYFDPFFREMREISCKTQEMMGNLTVDWLINRSNSTNHDVSARTCTLQKPTNTHTHTHTHGHIYIHVYIYIFISLYTSVRQNKENTGKF